MLNFQQQAKKLVANDEISWKKETIGPLLTNNSSKWKDEMDSPIIKLTEYCCDIAMVKGSYEYSSVHVNFRQTIVNLISRTLVSILSKIYVFKAICLVKKS